MAKIISEKRNEAAAMSAGPRLCRMQNILHSTSMNYYRWGECPYYLTPTLWGTRRTSYSRLACRRLGGSSPCRTSCVRQTSGLVSAEDCPQRGICRFQASSSPRVWQSFGLLRSGARVPGRPRPSPFLRIIYLK